MLPALAGAIVMDCNCDDVTRIPCLPVIPLCVAEIVAVPEPCPVAKPLPFTVATLALEEVQVTAFVIACVLLSL